jgi:hypothetical protein
LSLTYRDDAGRVDHELLYRANEAALEIEEAGRAWSFDADVSSSVLRQRRSGSGSRTSSIPIWRCIRRASTRSRIRVALDVPASVRLNDPVALTDEVDVGIVGRVSAGTTIDELVVQAPATAEMMALEESELVRASLAGREDELSRVLCVSGTIRLPCDGYVGTGWPQISGWLRGYAESRSPRAYRRFA